MSDVPRPSWSVRADRTPDGALRRLDVVQGDTVIAGVHLRYPPDDATHEARARVLAAGPEMLAMLAVLHGDMWCSCLERGGGAYRGRAGTVCRVADLIARAGGTATAVTP